MIVNPSLLGLFELKELVFGEKVAMVVGTGENGDGFRDGVVFDAGHGLATFGADGRSSRDRVGFRQNRVDIFGGFNGEEVGYVWEKKVTAAVEAFVDSLSLAVGGVYCYRRKRVVAVRASHEFILAKMSLVDLSSEN